MSPAAELVQQACRRYVCATIGPGFAKAVAVYGRQHALEILGSMRRHCADRHRNPRPCKTPVRVLKALMGDCEAAIHELVKLGELRLVNRSYEPPAPGGMVYAVLVEDDLPDYFRLKPRRSVAVF